MFLSVSTSKPINIFDSIVHSFCTKVLFGLGFFFALAVAEMQKGAKEL